MKRLSKNWLTEDLIDLEYKQYMLLAWLSEVHEQFDKQLVYPSLEELISHYRNLITIKDNADFLFRSFPEKLMSVDITNIRAGYEKVVKDDQLMEEIKQIIAYSIPQFESHLEEGKVVYNYVEQKLHIEPVGLLPLTKDWGYLLIELHEPRETRVYGYELKLFEDSGEQFRSLHTYPVKTLSNNYIVNPTSIKLDLIRENSQLPNPATFVMHSDLPFAFEQTYFPIAKRMLMKTLTQ
jgi:hypothetical protein